MRITAGMIIKHEEYNVESMEDVCGILELVLALAIVLMVERTFVVELASALESEVGIVLSDEADKLEFVLGVKVEGVAEVGVVRL